MSESNSAESAVLQKEIDRLTRKLRTAGQLIKEREAEVAALKGQVPAEGTQPISQKDADLLAQYKALGTPEALVKAKEDGTAAQARLKALERKDAVFAQAKEAGLNGAALWRLVEKDDAVALETEEADGQKVLYAKRGTERRPVVEEWAEFAPALQAGETAPPAAAKPAGKPLPPQHDAARRPTTGATDDDIRKNQQRRYRKLGL